MLVWEEARASFLAWSILVVFTVLPVLGYWFVRGKGKSLFPPQRRRLAAWTGFEVCLVFFFAQVLIPAFLLYLLWNITGFFNWLYGADFPSGPDSADKLAAARRDVWVMAFAFPFELVGTLLILRILGGTRLYQLGITTQDAGRNAVSGWLGWLLLTPPILFVHVVVVWACRLWQGIPLEEHPLARLAEAHPSGVEWFLIILLSVVAAPVMEELLFRRILQGWAARRPWGGPMILLVALALSLGNVWGSQDQTKSGSALYSLEPAMFVLSVASGCYLVERLCRRGKTDIAPHRSYPGRAIYSTALLFAASHIWPTPVPLFLLALALGYLAYRTQSLVAPIVFHALFNGVACVGMVLAYAGPANDKETTSAVRRVPSVSTSRVRRCPGGRMPGQPSPAPYRVRGVATTRQVRIRYN